MIEASKRVDEHPRPPEPHFNDDRKFTSLSRCLQLLQATFLTLYRNSSDGLRLIRKRFGSHLRVRVR